jgi:hypothetical protein
LSRDRGPTTSFAVPILQQKKGLVGKNEIDNKPNEILPRNYSSHLSQ